MKKLIFFLAAYASPMLLVAQAGVFYGHGTQLTPLENCDVALKKEKVSITRAAQGWVGFDIEYTLDNPGGARTLLLAFESIPESLEPVSAAQNPNLKGFTVEANDQRVAFKTIFVPEKDYYTGNGNFKTIPAEEIKKSLVDYDPNTGVNFMYLYYVTVSLRPGVNTLRHSYAIPWSVTDEPSYHFSFLPKELSRWAGGGKGDYSISVDLGPLAYFMLNSELKDDFTVVGRGKVWAGEMNEYFLADGRIEYRGKDISLDEYGLLFQRRAWPITDFDCESDTAIAPYLRIYYGDKEGKSDATCKVLRNLPFAMHGYVFRDPALKKYYEAQWWYSPDPEYKAVVSQLSPEEQKWVMQWTK